MVQGLLTRMLSLMASLHFKTLKTILATCQFLHTVQLLVFPYKNMEIIIIIIMIIPSLGIKWRKPTADQGWKPMMVRCGIPPSARRWKPTAGRSWKPTTARCWFCNRGPLLILQPRSSQKNGCTPVTDPQWDPAIRPPLGPTADRCCPAVRPTADRSWKPMTARCWFFNRGPLLLLQPRSSQKNGCTPAINPQWDPAIRPPLGPTADRCCPAEGLQAGY